MQPYEIREASAPRTPLVVSIPHTGTHIPEAIAARLASDEMRALPMTDWHLHHLYDFLPMLGVTTIYATWSRFVADLNRPPEPRELYPGRFETGLVAEQTFWGDTIWSAPPDAVEVEAWRKMVHQPYHEQLTALLERTRKEFGHAVLIDAHSVASRPSLVTGALTEDIYLGDRDGKSCAEWLTSTVEAGFRADGYKVVRNHPYKGGYITDYYGSLDHVDALQIEMAQRIYMDENQPGQALRHPDFAGMRGVLQDVFRKLTGVIRSLPA